MLLHALHHYALQAEIILADFNLAVSTQTDKPPNLIPHQIFWLYSMYLPSCAVQWYVLSVTVVHLIFTVVHFIGTLLGWTYRRIRLSGAHRYLVHTAY